MEFYPWVKVSPKTLSNHNFTVKSAVYAGAVPKLMSVLQYYSSILYKDLIFRATFGWIPRSDFDLKKKYLDIERAKNSELVSKVENALNYANRNVYFPAPFRLRFLPGMSGQRFRSFLNYLSNSLDFFHYLEIGVWKGSTAFCILDGTKASATLIDNWSQFGGPKETADKVLKKYIRNRRANILDIDFTKITEVSHQLKPHVYFYDAAHDYNSQKKAIELLDKMHFQELIVIIDDWNWENVKEGTRDALKSARVCPIAEWEITTRFEYMGGRFSSWHNGVFICILRKTFG